MRRAVLAAAAAVLLVAARQAPLDDQAAANARLALLVATSHVADPARRLVGVSFVCTIRVGRERFGIVDLREVVPKAGAPGGVNRVLLLDAGGRLRPSFDYGVARPIACRGSDLLLFGDADPRGDGHDGNVVSYGPGGRIANVAAVDAAKLWPPR